MPPRTFCVVRPCVHKHLQEGRAGQIPPVGRPEKLGKPQTQDQSPDAQDAPCAAGRTHSQAKAPDVRLGQLLQVRHRLREV